MLNEPELRAILDPIGDNRFHIPALIQQIESDLAVIPFVGAGMSVPFKLPEWRPFLESLALTAETRQSLKDFLDADEYELAAEYVWEIRGANAFQDAFDAIFGREVSAGKELNAAVRLLGKFPRGPVITTNFDCVLETVFTAQGCPFDDVITATKLDSARKAFQLNANVLLKIHGSTGDQFDRVLTWPEYEKAYAAGPLRIILENVATRSLLFLGCSLKNDRPLRVLRSLAAEGRRFTDHFAFLEQPTTDSELLARTKELRDIGIRSVFYPQKGHDLIESMLAMLCSKVAEGRSRSWRGKRRPRVHNLPVPTSVLFGREEQLQLVIDAMERRRITIIEGSKGVGKTALTLHAYQRLVDKDSFGALVWTSAAVKKSTFTLADILDAISLTLDFPFTPQTSTDEKERLVISELENNSFRSLITVDNYEAITERNIDDFLIKRLPKNCTVLITSAAAVPFEHTDIAVIALDELLRDDALALFRQRTEERGIIGFVQSQIDQLYAVAGGNPLLLEWIAGQMRAGKPLENVLADLSSGKAEILDVFQGSWEMLSTEAKTMLCAISLFPTAPSQETLQRTCAFDEDRFLKAVTELKRLYLIKTFSLQSTVALEKLSATRFTMHPFTREFVERQREQTGDRDLFANAASHLIAFVSEHGGSPDKEDKQDLQALNTQRQNMLAVLDGCRRSGGDACVVELTRSAARWLFIEGHWSDLELWAPRAIEAAKKIGNYSAAGLLAAELGRVYSQRSQFNKAEEAFVNSLAFASGPPPDTRTLGYLKHHMGEARLRQKRYPEARELLEESLVLFRAVNSRRDMIGAGYRLAVLSFEEGKREEARQRLERGIDDCIEESWDRLEGFHRRYLGELEMSADDPHLFKARDQLERARDLITETDTRMRALIELSLATLEERIGNPARALDNAKAARDHFEKLRMKKELEETISMVRRLSIAVPRG